jgi:hypothetical protein
MGGRVPGALANAQEAKLTGIFGAPRALRLVVGIMLFPFDDVLRGMVSAGQGIEVLCLFLELTRGQLDDHLIRLGLATPHNRPMRKAGGIKAWSVADVIRLIAWRVAGVHPEIIGLKLGRSAGAVRSKARRLGLRAPPRKLLHKPDLNSLRDPEPGFGWKNQQSPALPASPQAACGRVAGVISFNGRESVGSFVNFSGQSGGKHVVSGFFGGSVGQRELPLFGVVGGTARQEHKKNAVKAIPEFVIPKTEAEVDFNGDLQWIGSIRPKLTNKLVVWICGMLWMGGVHYAEAAKRVGMTSGAFRSFRHRAGIPVDTDRKKFGSDFDAEVAHDTLKDSGLTLRQCVTTNKYGGQNWFWAKRTDFGTRISPPKRKRDHQIEGRYPRATVLKGRDAKPKADNVAPFANDTDKNRCSRNSWSAAHA